MTALLCLAFFLSGASALLFETLWFRQAGLALGNSIWASSLVLAGFMAGLALGNGIAGRVGHRVRRPLRLYAGLELAIGVAGVALVHLLPALAPWLAPLLRPLLDVPALLNPLRLVLAFALLVVPSTMMGATLPLLVGALHRRDPRFGRVLGLLYGWNTLGAVVGAVIGEAALLALLGVRGAALVAAGANLVAALVAFSLAPSLDRAPEQGVADGAALRGRSPARLLAAAAITGAILLALEVIWFRFLILFLLPDALAFAVILAVVLAGIGLGGLAASQWLSRSPDAYRALPVLCLGSGALTFGSYALFGLSLRPFAQRVVFDWPEMLALGVPLMLPVALLSGVLFTFLGEALERAAPAAMRSAGYLALANTAGAALGSLAGGFLLLPLLGIERSLQLLAAAYAIPLLLTAPRANVPARAAARWATAGAVCVAAASLPSGLMEQRYLPVPVQRLAARDGSVFEAAREGLTETILYLRNDLYGEPRFHRLVTNSHSMSSTEAGGRRYMKLFVYLPVALHEGPRSALLISYGVGVTAKALTDTAELETIDVVDTSRDILEMSEIVYPDRRDHPLADPRVRVHVEDGRHFLQTTDRRFDLITGEPPPPKAAGIVNLYTREYFRLLRDRLADGGIATYWLPVHSLEEGEAKAIIRAFCDAFADCTLWAGSDFDWNLVGTRGRREPVDAARFGRQWRDPVVGPDLRALAFERPEQLAALFLADAEQLRAMTAGAQPLTDDRPKRLGRVPLTRPQARRAYREWMNVRWAEERLNESEIAARLLPEEVRDASSTWFPIQARINAFALRERGSPAQELRIAHRLLVGTELETLPLWYLDGNADTQRAALQSRARGRRGPGIEAELGIGALSRREFEAAAEHFRRARALPGATRDALYYRLYALCMSGRCEEAAQIAKREGMAADGSPADAGVWQFLVSEFPVDGAAPRAAPGARDPTP